MYTSSDAVRLVLLNLEERLYLVASSVKMRALGFNKLQDTTIQGFYRRECRRDISQQLPSLQPLISACGSFVTLHRAREL